MNCRLEQKDYFNYMSTVGESSVGEITLINPDHGNDHRVRLQVNRFKVTRSYGYDYRCLSCQKGHSVLDPDSITIVLADQFSPDALPPNTDRSCTCLIRYHGLTMEDLNYLILGPLNEHGPTWQGLKAYGIADLLIKCTKQGIKGVLDGTIRDRGGGVRPG